jgi:hypothetical protein
MADQSHWNPKSLDETFIYRGREAHSRLKECLIKAKDNILYQAFADEAAARASVYDYLDGRSFLRSREELLSGLRELTAMPAPNVEAFDRERFLQSRFSAIGGLLREFDGSSQTE